MPSSTTSSSVGPCPRAHGYIGLAALAWFLWQWNLIGWQYA
ncbi:MAG TPA: hypothetical protein VFR67_29670 [Pilimelia sp.]|nr:hypothetical protein [Pilimelia sp.]